MKAFILEILHRYVPPALFDVILRATGRKKSGKVRYQSVITSYSSQPIHSGRYGDLYERYYSLNPRADYNWLRYRFYNICMSALFCRSVPGDFVCMGVDYGVAPRMVYDFVDFTTLGKTLHLVDPFQAIWDTATRSTRSYYNTDPEYVRKQYPTDAPVQIHRAFIPDALPLPGVTSVAFAFMDTGDADAEAKSIPIIFDQLSSGGAIILDRYGSGDGFFGVYDPVFAKLGVTPFWLPSGQCIVRK